MKQSRAGIRSSALLITLVFMALITIVLVGFLSSMRINRPAAYLYAERNRAAFYAQDGVAESVATLDQILLHTNQTWISQPGQLMVVTGTGGMTAMLAIPLSSSTNSSLIPSSMASYPAPDLNIASSRDSTDHIISNTGGSLHLNWIYVLQDGTRSQYLNATNAYQWAANTSFSPTPGNPIVGRFAYWTDDESTKINVNTAWGRGGAGNTDMLSSPTMVDLTALNDSTNQITQAMANGLHGYVTTNSYATLNNPFFDSSTQARQLAASAAAVKHFKGELTSYNHDPGLNMFGQPRFVLTTRPDRAGWTYNGTTWIGQNGLSGDPGTTNAGTPYYLRILGSEGVISAPNQISGSSTNIAADPGLAYNTTLNSTHLNNTMNTLAGYLQNTSWPVTSGATNSFASKFYPSGTNVLQGQYLNSGLSSARSAQLALNIIEYVRCKESPQPIVGPIRIDQTVHATSTNYGFYGGEGTVPENTFFGTTRAPFLNEVGVWCPTGPTFGFIVFYVEIYNPVNYGIVNYPVNNLTIAVEAMNVQSGQDTPSSDFFGLGAINSSTAATINPGSYVVGRFAPGSSDAPPQYTFNPRPTYLTWRIILATTRGVGNIGIVPYMNSSHVYNGYSNSYLPIPVNTDTVTTPTLSPLPNIQTTEIDDPRLGSHPGAWKWHSFTAGAVNNSLGAVNSNYLTNADLAPAGIAQQDTDSSGKLTDTSLYMPPPAGTTAPITYYTYGSNVNPLGYVTSVGELGYVCSGMEIDTYGYSDPTKTSSFITNLPPGVPWRTLRLQPNNNPDTSTIPDWALLDLFAAPVNYNAQGAPVLTPNANTVGGQVNINTALQPTNYDSARSMPLQAVFLGATNTFGSTNSFATAQTLSSNIMGYVLSPSSVNGTGKNYPSTTTTGYLTAGQIAEIQGVSDSGEASEENFRQVIGQLATRGDVFTIYSVGQALKVSGTGNVTVTGEQRLQTTVERFQDPSSGAISLHTTYYRSVVP